GRSMPDLPAQIVRLGLDYDVCQGPQRSTGEGRARKCRYPSRRDALAVERRWTHLQTLALLQLGVHRVGDARQLLATDPAGDYIGERPVDPVERAEAVALGKLECGVVEPRLLAHVEREAPAGRVLVHEL